VFSQDRRFIYLAKGLSPRPDPAVAALPSGHTEDSKTKKQEAKERLCLSFSSGPPQASSSRPTTSKRKAVGDGRAEGDARVEASRSKGKAKKPKVGLSFADEA
jgi:hypothetical protein